MAVFDPYASCPCGSGKKFKWCCQPIHAQVQRVFELEEQGQHDSATKAMDQLTAEHPSNPEVFGRKAQLLYNRGQVEEAETALQKAFDISPDYAFGHYLQGRFRYNEGEIAGALILFRKATQLYDPNAALIVSDIYALLSECELRLNRPVASRAAMEIAVRANPQNNSLNEFLDGMFGDQSPLPASAKKQYQFQPVAEAASPERKKQWEQALAAGATGRLADAVKPFEQLTQQDQSDAPAWYNLGLSRAWLGNNAGALEAFDRYISLETDETKAAGAWALGEVMRFGQGLEDQADVCENFATFVMKDGQALSQLLGELEKSRRLIGVQVSEDQTSMTGLILEKLPPALAPELESKQAPHMAAALLIMGNVIQLRNVFKPNVDKLFEEFKQHIGGAMGESRVLRGPARFNDVLSEGMVFPVNAASQEQGAELVKGGLESFLEETWIHRNLKSLGGVPPIDAAGHPVLKKKLLGLVQFLEECAALGGLPVDFSRLRRKLNLAGGDGAAPAAAAASGTGDITALGVAELAGLDAASLSPEQLEQGYQTSLKLDARDLAGKFAQELVQRPFDAARADRFVWFNHLIQLHTQTGQFDQALDFVNEGERDDCEHNEGRRRNEYELRRGQLHAKRGEIDQAHEVFQRLTDRVPDDSKFLGTATEAMLSAKQGARAKSFAEKGLALAKKQKNRDSEGYFQELLAAAGRHV